ncbi:MAG: nucleotidyltransferase domain-containing protein [Defluviitaleaceae bacterium]|nr:nucleotidyltransferase domain-containing protein [Defluviitaleaceae bacterium]
MKPLKPLKPFVREFLDEFVRRFTRLGIDAEALVLFGSQARGEAKLSSDIDIAVLATELSPTQRGALRGLGEEIDDRLTVNLFFTTKQALIEAEGVFDTNKYIRDEGVVLWQR